MAILWGNEEATTGGSEGMVEYAWLTLGIAAGGVYGAVYLVDQTTPASINPGAYIGTAAGVVVGLIGYLIRSAQRHMEAEIRHCCGPARRGAVGREYVSLAAQHDIGIARSPADRSPIDADTVAAMQRISMRLVKGGQDE